MSPAPCHHCEKRTVGCHATCEDYLIFHEAQLKIRKARWTENDFIGYVSDEVKKNNRRNHRK